MSLSCLVGIGIQDQVGFVKRGLEIRKCFFEARLNDGSNRLDHPRTITPGLDGLGDFRRHRSSHEAIQPDERFIGRENVYSIGIG